MKVGLVLFINIFLVVSNCSDDKKTTKDTQEKTENWELTLMRSGSKADNENQTLPYKENYAFKDSTFIKSRLEGNEYEEAWGSYKKSKTEEGIYYKLNYDHTAHITGSCTGNDSEDLLLREDGKLQNTWMMCDGPFKVYSKKQN